ncbi:hypothetical protein [Flavobacterium sp. I3-2]|uniref:hypothetical protein n=1 Tax=Flavobacterium sp. I3-2 TaxID=2748319 RepID=UPI0015ADF570|nr:hypothetical protein [Flavobacterium sp. I3-2]
MTRYIFPIILILFGFSSKAQESATAKLSVQINNIQSIRINEQQQNVEISINSIEDFRNGKSNYKNDHIEVMSNGKYEIRVVANGHLLKGDEKINIDQIKLTPNFGTKGRSTNDINFFPIDLSLENNKIISSSKGDIIRSFNMNYHLKGGDQLMNTDSGTYNTTITYTIIAL